MSVTPRGMSVQEAYRSFRDGAFRVNRQYQRKLVWTLQEKQKLIDSLLRGYPIPLILLAVRPLQDGSREFEILDGMQRLNAVFSFIENKFSIDGHYFDVQQLSRAKQLADEGVFKAQESDVLAPDLCADFLDYTLAVTEFPAVDGDAVNEVFSRINSYGRQLSPQERRQAGVLTPFANAIREVAAEIRGDVSRISLDLADMPEISVDVNADDPGLGIRADDTFWCKQGVLRKNQLREGEDEQLLADLAISILLEEPFAFSGAALDEVYDEDSIESQRVSDALRQYGVDALKHDLLTTISILRGVVEDVDSSPNAMRRIVHPTAGSNPIKTAFYAIAMAFYELCIREEKSPRDSALVMRALANIQPRLSIAAGQIGSDSRRQNINVAKGVISSLFDERSPPASVQGAGLMIRFENSLRRSKVETAAFECKQGFLSLNGSREINLSLLDRLLETICGIANVGPSSEGAIFVGVADNLKDANRIAALDGLESLKVGERFVVGVDREARLLGEDLDVYKRRFVQHVRASNMSEPLKTSVLSNVDCITYRGMSVLCIWVPSQKKLSSVGDMVFLRHGAETVKVEGLTRMQAAMEIFQHAN
ncbi:GmrSD restriction endonuclease domain-containing protein [Lysobacter enzymogenes]|uniref:GmrSD restriction endonuclease domain-containing protein n=1 Tax=Lysobacter enzymogenes TaxID=69 RepID=UPI001A964A58|nr:DUF262 domain-containing protein [Lysobacter enzymogenes]QQP94118.1 DUF262 domain-containing protein [Lysobacter enzymogenes]